MEAALVALMLADAGLAAQVGDRINWEIFPQGIGSPCVRLTRIGGATGYHMRGSDGLDGAQVQVDIRAAAPIENDAAGFKPAKGAADAAKALLSGYRGTVADVCFGGIFVTAERHYTEKTDGNLFHVVSLDLDIWSRRPA